MTGGRYADDLEASAARVLPEPVFRYVCQGARAGVSANEATSAWRRHRFVPRVLRDVTEVSVRTSLLGRSDLLPVGIAPTTLQRGAHADGEAGMARAAAAAGAVMVLSSNSGTTVEDVAATGVQWWFQLYVTADRHACTPLLGRAVAAGASGIVLTADTPVVGTKYAVGPSVWDIADPGWVRANFGPDSSGPAYDKATDLGPADIEWLAATTGLPVVVKGVLHPADARRCVEAGAAAVWVSNHGGRQLDGVVATADRLAAVLQEVRTEVEVYVDGGIRSAHEALVALALGASGVFLGRQPLYALAVDGAEGVSRLLDELAVELTEGLRLLGCGSIADLGLELLAPTRAGSGGGML